MTDRDRDRVLSVVRHPSFAPEIAARVVDGLSWHDLQSIWDVSEKAVQATQPPREMMSFVLLRDALLGEMEHRHPDLFPGWYDARLRRRQRRAGLPGRLRALLRR
ncbi:hypothetical protein [Nocardioides dilutus]